VTCSSPFYAPRIIKHKYQSMMRGCSCINTRKLYGESSGPYSLLARRRLHPKLQTAVKTELLGWLSVIIMETSVTIKSVEISEVVSQKKAE